MGRAIGVEIDRKEYNIARANALNELSKHQLGRIDFWLGRYDSEEDDGRNLLFDYKDATVIYHSFVEEDDHEISFYKERLNKKKVRVVTKDLPLVDYEPNKASRDCADSWFFLHQFPLKRVRNRDEWAKMVLRSDDVAIKDVLKHCRRQWEKRVSKYESYDKMKLLKKLVCYRF